MWRKTLVYRGGRGEGEGRVREVRGRFKREGTYIPMANSCCCMAETNKI